MAQDRWTRKTKDYSWTRHKLDIFTDDELARAAVGFYEVKEFLERYHLSNDWIDGTYDALVEEIGKREEDKKK